MTRALRPDHISGWHGLAAAVLARALADAQRGNREAAAWLMWGDGRDIAELAGVDCDYWRENIRERISAGAGNRTGAAR